MAAPLGAGPLFLIQRILEVTEWENCYRLWCLLTDEEQERCRQDLRTFLTKTVKDFQQRDIIGHRYGLTRATFIKSKPDVANELGMKKGTIDVWEAAAISAMRAHHNKLVLHWYDLVECRRMNCTITVENGIFTIKTPD